MTIKSLLWSFLVFFLMSFQLIQAISSSDYYKPIETVSFYGLSHIKESQLPLKTLSTQPHLRLNQETLTKDLAKLYLTGFFKEVSAETSPTQNNHVTLQFNLKENPIVAAIVLRGVSVFSPQTLKETFKNRPGVPLNIQFLQEDKIFLETVYANEGYSLFKVIDMTLTSQNVLVIDCLEGHIESLEFEGLKNLRPFAVKRELRLAKGSVFNSKILKEDRERLQRLGYFSDISFPHLDIGSDPSQVKVSFNVTEKKVNLIDIGLEQANDKVVFFAQNNWNHTFIQHTDILTTKIRVSNETNNTYALSSYNLKYVQPWLFNWIPLSMSIELWSELKQEFLSNDLSQTLQFDKRTGGAIGFSYPLLRDQLTFSTRTKFESVIPQQSATFNPYEIHSVSAVLSYKNLVNLNNPKNGMYGSLEYEKGGDLGIVNLKGLDFSRTTAQFAGFISPTPHIVLGIHPLIGIFQPNGHSTATFETEAYTLGGSNSLRGYKETSPFIGNRKLVLNSEFRYDFNESVQGVLFYDIGRVFSESESFLGTTNYHAGYGFGFRFLTPLGPFRTDFAWGEALIIHFGIGQVF